MKPVSIIDQLGTAGLWLTILFSPCCFPLAAVIFSFLGMSTSFELFGSWTFYVLQATVIISVLGMILAWKTHQCLYPLLLAIPSAGLIFYSYYFVDSQSWTYLVYIGMTGLLISTIINYYRSKMNNVTELYSTITCPHCGHSEKEEMPTNSCQYFYSCTECKTTLKPKEGDCCVYCSYGSVPCPPIQNGKSCC